MLALGLKFAAHANTAFATGHTGMLLQLMVLYGTALLLLYATAVYLFARWRLALPSRESGPAGTPTLDDPTRLPLLALVPSYREEEKVVAQALLSAALIEYSRRRVVLLIDDPPFPDDEADGARLAAVRDLPVRLQEAFDTAREHVLKQLMRPAEPSAEASKLAGLYEWVAGWLERVLASIALPSDSAHTDALFVARILREPARAHRDRADTLRRSTPGQDDLSRARRHLASLFEVEFTSFERKRYVNLSHTPNKAMNLNSYLALLGRSFRCVVVEDGWRLERCDAGAADLAIPSADYIVAIDADSIVTADYASRLVPVMEAPGSERIAVAQTPYTAVPGPSATIERVAAASTDAQFFLHQGMARCDASFWVGASALMRRSALEDIRTTRIERGHEVAVYIDDRILIEDAAATVDLLRKGWRIHHDGGRLAYSATPSDFGALLIQRRRWANGGLLLVPRLLGQALRTPWSARRLGHVLLRLPNLLSATLAGIGVPLLLLVRFDDHIIPLWLPLLALPYYAVYGGDVVRAGHRWQDVLRIYALNAILIPVNLAGTFQSLRQIRRGAPIPFQRTPKVAGRTATPAPYLVAIYGFCIYALLGAAVDGSSGEMLRMSFGILNGVAAIYGLVAFVGLRESWHDLRTGLVRGRARLARRQRSTGPATPLAAPSSTSTLPLGPHYSAARMEA
jgi:cellulose synthase/poly-beta-1,6-N-acetylglucosamine synthase-like glycosyltransferase